MKSILSALGVLLLLAIVGWSSYTLSSRSRQTSLQLAPTAPVRVRIPLPSSDFLAPHLEGVIDEARRTLEAEEAGPQAQPSIPDTPPLSPRERELQDRSAAYAYIEYGRIGENGLATFLDVRTQEQVLREEGSLLDGMKVSAIGPENLTLTWQSEKLEKPRVDLEVDPPSSSAISAEEKEKFQVRWRELWGNLSAKQGREKAAQREAMGAAGEDFSLPPEVARQEYLRKWGNYQRDLESASPEEVGLYHEPVYPTAGEAADRRMGILTSEPIEEPKP
jgi:hypothetical protein